MLRSSILALALLCAVQGRPHPQQPKKARATREPRRAAHDELRLERFAAHASSHNQKQMDFKAKTRMALPKASNFFRATASDTDSTGTTEVEATYGDMTYYDYSVPVSVETTDGDMVELAVIMDTGSSNLAVATSACSNCDCLTESFEVELADPSYCLEVTYGSGEWYGALAASSVSVKLGDLEGSADDALTTITTQNSFFDGDDYQGIFGLSYQALAGSYSACTGSNSNSRGRGAGRWTQQDARADPNDHRPQQQQQHGDSKAGDESTLAGQTLLDTFAKESVIEDRVFAIDYCGDEATLSIGAVDDSTYSGEVVYVSTQKTYGEFYGYFLTKVDSVTFDSEDIDISDSNINEYGGALVDSGTTLLYLPSSIVSQIETKVETLCSACDSGFFNDMRGIPASTAKTLPSLTITLDADDGSGSTYDLELTFKNYLIEYEGYYYWGVSTSDFPIIGNIAQNGRTVVFDLDNNKLGFASAECSSTSSLSFVDPISSFQSLSLGAMVSMIVAAVVLVAGAAFIIMRRQGRATSTDEAKYTYRLLNPEDDEIPSYTEDEQPNEITL